jgi:hypothetical protein
MLATGAQTSQMQVLISCMQYCIINHYCSYQYNIYIHATLRSVVLMVGDCPLAAALVHHASMVVTWLHGPLAVYCM